MTAFKAVEGVQQYCNILGRATASLSAAFTCICYVLVDLYTHVSKHLLYFWTTSIVVFRTMYKLSQTLLCIKIMLCLKERIAASLITKKLFNSYTLLPSSVSCVQVSNHKRAELSDFDEKNFNRVQTHDECENQKAHCSLLGLYCKMLNSIAAINSRKQGMKNSSDEAQSTWKIRLQRVYNSHLHSRQNYTVLSVN